MGLGSLAASGLASTDLLAAAWGEAKTWIANKTGSRCVRSQLFENDPDRLRSDLLSRVMAQEPRLTHAP